MRELRRTDRKKGFTQGRIEILPERVAELAKRLYTVNQIASHLGVSHDTLQRRLKEPEFAGILECNQATATTEIIDLQMAAARKLNPALLIWLGKQYLGQKDVVEQHVTGADGGPLELRVIYRSPAPVIDVTPEPRQITNGHPSTDNDLSRQIIPNRYAKD